MSEAHCIASPRNRGVRRGLEPLRASRVRLVVKILRILPEIHSNFVQYTPLEFAGGLSYWQIHPTECGKIVGENFATAYEAGPIVRFIRYPTLGFCEITQASFVWLANVFNPSQKSPAFGSTSSLDFTRDNPERAERVEGLTIPPRHRVPCVLLPRHEASQVARDRPRGSTKKQQVSLFEIIVVLTLILCYHYQ